MKPSVVTSILPEMIAMRRPLMLWGKSGIGKSSVVRQVAKAMGRKLNDMRLSQLDSIDLRGFPVPNMKSMSMDWLPSIELPREGDPDGILFLDECNGAMPTVASAAYQLILDGRIGTYVLPANWAIVAAGNNTSDRGVTHQMPAPLNNRFVHIDMEVDADDFQAQAGRDGISVEVRAYLRTTAKAIFQGTGDVVRFMCPKCGHSRPNLGRRLKRYFGTRTWICGECLAASTEKTE